MFSLSVFFLGLLEVVKYSLLQLWIWVQDWNIFSAGAILGLIMLCTARYLASPYRKLPTGPRGYPIIGNLFEMTARTRNIVVSDIMSGGLFFVLYRSIEKKKVIIGCARPPVRSSVHAQ